MWPKSWVTVRVGNWMQSIALPCIQKLQPPQNSLVCDVTPSIFSQLPTLSSTRSSLLRSAWQPSPPMRSRRPSPSLIRTRVASLRRTSWSKHPHLNFIPRLLEALVARGSAFLVNSEWCQSPKASERLRLRGALLDCNSMPVLSSSVSCCTVI